MQIPSQISSHSNVLTRISDNRRVQCVDYLNQITLRPTQSQALPSQLITATNAVFNTVNMTHRKLLDSETVSIVNDKTRSFSGLPQVERYHHGDDEMATVKNISLCEPTTDPEPGPTEDTLNPGQKRQRRRYYSSKTMFMSVQDQVQRMEDSTTKLTQIQALRKEKTTEANNALKSIFR